MTTILSSNVYKPQALGLLNKASIHYAIKTLEHLQDHNISSKTNSLYILAQSKHFVKCITAPCRTSHS